MTTAMHYDDVGVGERQRTVFDPKGIQDLADSIFRVGLIHAPVFNVQTGKLVAGERRMRAIALLYDEDKSFVYGDEKFSYPDVPVIEVNRVDQHLIFEIELEENLRRVNLSPMEEAQAIAKLHSIRLEEDPAHTRKQTAAEVAEKQGKVLNANDEVRVAESILVEQFKDDPEVQKAAKVSIRKAASVAKKKIELDLVRALQGAEALAADSLFQVYAGRAEEVMDGFSPESFDILLFDPPYGVGADKFGEQAFDLGHQYEDDISSATKLTLAIVSEFKRIGKEQAHILMFCSFELFSHWKNIYENEGWKVWPRPIIWDKGNGHLPVPDHGPRYTYECILFAQRGGRKTRTVINDVIRVSPVRDKIHAAEKPAALLETLIDFVAGPGDSILDPCVGSGSIFTGGRGKEVFITGIELDPKYYAIAKERARG